MLFKKLTFNNYKTYYGVQEIQLYIPEDIRKEENKNIILLGGLNGAGKTTILKAISYVLFGKRGMKPEEHKKLFSNVINNTFFDEGGRDCSVSLVIETDRKETYDIKIKWSFDNAKRVISENRELVARKAGVGPAKTVKIDNIEVFNKFIDNIIPYHAAPFFIFDGEEIKDIILRQNSTEMREAIHKITGMGTYKQLLQDLSMLKGTMEQNLAKAVSQGKLNNLNTKLDTVQSELKVAEEKRLAIVAEKEKQQQLITDAQRIRNEKIILNSKSRETVVKKLSSIDSYLIHTKKELASIFKEHAIGIILGEKITKLRKRLHVEGEARQQKVLRLATLAPYENFMHQLLEEPINPPLSHEQLLQLKQLGEKIWIKENKIKTTVDTDFTELHDLSSKDYHILNNYAIKDKSHIVSLINRIEQLQFDLQNAETELQNAPESVDIHDENKAIDILTKNFGELNIRYKAIVSKINKLKDERTSIKNQVTRLAELGSNFEDLQEKLQYITNLIKTVEQYIQQITVMKATFIKNEFIKMLQKLFRKQTEFGLIEFDVTTYTIKLFNDKNQEISIQDRSAGEMQIISSAFIWALTKASSLHLPMVIDTPLGRLDSHHRNHLMEHYYKDLSDQVIILSTDTEITQEYVDLMKKHSYKQYMLDYDEIKKYTVIRDGYFNFVKA